MMIIDCISDLHGFYPSLQGGDLLIIAGDLTARDTYNEYGLFNEWLCDLDYQKKIIIAGNHDGYLQAKKAQKKYFCDGSYLEDSFEEYEGLKIWGSPWTPTFYNWYFMKNRGPPIKEKWDLIPEDIDILVTHGPPFGILDRVRNRRGDYTDHVGCSDLLIKCGYLKNLKLHVFGHIHEGYGHKQINGCHLVNASHVNEVYDPINKPIRIIL